MFIGEFVKMFNSVVKGNKIKAMKTLAALLIDNKLKNVL